MSASPTPAARERLSFNQITVDGWSLREAVDGCRRADIGHIGVWRHKVEEVGLAEAARMIADAGLSVSSLCRGGFFPAATARERRERIDDTRQAIDEAVALGTDVLCLVCGGPVDRDLAPARAMVADAVAALAPHAADAGVTLAIEPLHPMQAADRSVIVTLAQAVAIAEAIDSPNVGVMVDVYHVWWDPEVHAQIGRAGSRIAGFQVCDWVKGTRDTLMERAMPGDGVIDIRGLRAGVEAAGYTGPIEVEIFNEAIWGSPGDEVLKQLTERWEVAV